MAFKKGSLLGRFRSRKKPIKEDEEEKTNLGKNLTVETMPLHDEEEEEVLADEELVTPEVVNENDEEETLVEAPVEETEAVTAEKEEMGAEYEGQLTIDVFQTDREIVIVSTIAGVDPTDIDVAIDNDMVTIKGERKSNFSVAEDDYYYQECYWGAFSRSVILPVDVVADRAEASLKNGILTIKLPKAKQSRTKKISVKAG